MWPFKRKEPAIEHRSSGTGYTTQVMQARADYISGVDGVAELTGTVQGCVSLWGGWPEPCGRGRHRHADTARPGPCGPRLGHAW